MVKREQGNGYIPKKRNTNTRERKPIIVIAVEGGNKTERLYFRDMAQTNNRILKFAKGNSTDPIHMAEALEEACKELDKDLGDCAFCLVDSDFISGKDDQIAAADQLGQEAGFKVLVSSPCFEVWFLCHYTNSTKKYRSNNEVIRELCKHLPGYSKSLEGIFSKTSSLLDTAICNAKTLEEACISAGYHPHTLEFLPSTEVYKLVEELMK